MALPLSDQTAAEAAFENLPKIMWTPIPEIDKCFPAFFADPRIAAPRGDPLSEKRHQNFSRPIAALPIEGHRISKSSPA
jgi:hypothetical protein